MRCLIKALLVGLVLTVGRSLFAQDALQSAILGDRSYETRQAVQRLPREGRTHLGPVDLTIGATYGLMWSDNIRLSPTNPKEDFIHEPSLNVHAVWPATKDSVLSFGLGVGYQVYMDNSDLNSLSITPDSEVAWDIPIEDWIITLHDKVSYSQDVISQGGLSGVAQFPRLENTVGVRAQWLPEQYFVEFGYDHVNFVSGASAFAYLTRSSEQFYSRAGYRFAPMTRAGLEVSGSLTDYRDPTRGDNQSLSVGPFVDWQLTRALRLTLRGGYVIYYLSPGQGRTNNVSNLNSHYFGASAMHRLTEFFTHSISVDRSVEQGINQGSSFSERLIVSYNASWAFHRSATLTLGPFYENGKEGQFGVPEDYDRLGGMIGLSTSPTEHLGLNLTYRYTEKTSNFSLVNRDYTQNMVTFTASYRF